MLYVFEGIDGSGKSSVAKAVAAELNARLIEFPNYDSPTGMLIKEYLRGEWFIHDNARTPDWNATAMAFQSLNVTNRMEVMVELAHTKGSPTEHVVLTRYWQSGWVYGQLEGLDPDWLYAIHESMVQPDLSILVDVPALVGYERQRRRDDGQAERYEHIELLAQAVELYHHLWRVQPRHEAIDGVQPLPTVIRDAKRAIAHAG